MKKSKTDRDSMPTEKSPPCENVSDFMMLLYGPPKVGKSTFASEFNDPLFFSTDRGTRHFSAYRREINKWSKLLNDIKKLEEMKTIPYGCFVIDHADDLYEMCETYVCKKLGIEDPGELGYGKGWRALTKEFNRTVQRLLGLNKGIIWICHETIRTVKTKVSETDRTMPDLNKRAWKIIVPLTDIIAYAGFDVKKEVVNGKKKKVMTRVLVTEPSEELYVGDRTGRCLPRMELNGQKFIKHFLRGANNVKEEQRQGSEKEGRRGRRSGRR